MATFSGEQAHAEVAGAEICLICGATMRQAFTATVLGRHAVRYFGCPDCRHFRTESPHWLEQAYSRAIAGADTGLVMRNLMIARQLACVLFEFFDRDARYLDTAGGTGLLTRRMRDIGFDFFWEDPYCENVLAYGFEGPRGVGGYAAVSAFEALEHMADPLAFIRSCLDRSADRTLIFSTELFEGDLPPPDWWYFAFPTGQHISFFCNQTLQRIAATLGVRFLSHGGLHALTRHDISSRAWRRTVDRVDRGLFERVARKMVSRTQADHELMLRRAAGAA